uniref:WxxW domain-containing protein n=1 Tax=Salarias fasciatus TaxID=181472 RepID=A0A672IKR7_SALFA
LKIFACNFQISVVYLFNYFFAECWTPWLDRDDPDKKGDWELHSQFLEEKRCFVCPNPTDIDVTTVKGNSVASTGEVIFQKDSKGFICRNEDQPDGRCCDYRVRFACHAPFCDRVCNWTRFFSRDNAFAKGDYELLSDLRVDFPGEICDDPVAIEAVTVDTLTPAIHTGDNIHIYCPSKGFVCRAEDQPSHRCHNYKVRFGCPCR